MRLRRVPELQDQRMPFERVLHDPSLNTLAAAVNQTDLTKSSGMRRMHVLLDHRRDVSRCECVEVENVFDGNFVERHVNSQFPTP